MSVMHVKVTRKFADLIDGIDLSRLSVGDVIAVPVRDGHTLIAEGWAVPHDGNGEIRPARATSAEKPRRARKAPAATTRRAAGD